jgi:DNA-binding LacI/PurR family transcriptional regulator
MPQKPFVSAQEVAERAGVSRSAVSRTFTPGASVSPETRRRVVEAAEALGYHVNHLARGLMRNESGIVCLIVSEMSTPYRANLIRAMTQHLQNAGKVAMLINTDRSDGSVDLALRQAIRYRADASIILSGMPDRSITQLCLKNGQRLVLINRDDDQQGPLRINLDDAEAAGAGRHRFRARRLPASGLREFAGRHPEPDGARTRLRGGGKSNGPPGSGRASRADKLRKRPRSGAAAADAR